jgi:hypothetical protein
MKATSLIIALSLAASAILAVLLFRADHASPAKTGEAETSASSVATTSAVGRTGASVDAVATPVAPASWRDFQVEDLKEFIRRLRAAGCPEGTIEDLVIAEVNRRYAPKLRALWSEESLSNDYWKSYQRNYDPAKVKKNRERLRQQQALQKEKIALLVELFGVDVEKQRLKEEGIDNEGWNPNGSLSFLPESKRNAVQKYLDDFQDREQDFYARVRGGWDDAARAEQKKLEQEKLAGLAQFLTPEELREYELRNSQMASQIASDLRGVSLTREQYEALFDIRKKYGDSIYNWSDAANDAATIKQIEQNKKNMQAEIATALGADKQQKMERAQDYSYQQLDRLAKRNDLPPDTASKIYDFKQAVEKAAQDLRLNTGLAPEQQQAALAQIRAETEQSVKTALGDKLYKRYLNNGGWWLNNIARPPSK